MQGALHIKYRPKSFDEFKGEYNKSVIESLKQQIEKDWENIPRTFLFAGQSGCGKTTIARILANALGCSDRDLHEYNTANTRGIDTIRDIGMQCQLAPFNSKAKAYLMDEAHQITKDAQHSLLKILEDTPMHVFFFLCTTEPSSLLETIRNRCSTYNVYMWLKKELYAHLKSIVEKEQGTVHVTVLNKIATASDGSPRRALTMLDQVLFMEDKEEASKLVLSFSDIETKTQDICKLLVERSYREKWDKMAVLLKDFDGEPESTRYAILGYLTMTMLNKPSDRLEEILSLFMDSWMYKRKAGLVQACYIACKL